MEMKLPFSRIRCPRDSAFSPQAHRAAHLIAFAEPAYPPSAKERGVEGTVLLDVLIDCKGAICSLSVAQGHALLAESAVHTVRNWRYRPTTVNGIPVEVQTQVEVTFSLPDSVVTS